MELTMEITICISTPRKTVGLNLPGHVQHPVGIAPESLDRNNIFRRCCWRTDLKQVLKKHGHFPKSNRARASHTSWLEFRQDAPIFLGCYWLEVCQGSPWEIPKFARLDDDNRFYRGRWIWRGTFGFLELILLFPFAKLFSPCMNFDMVTYGYMPCHDWRYLRSDMTPICILDARFLIGIITHPLKKVNIILP